MYGAAKPISIGAFGFSRIHDYGLVRLHIGGVVADSPNPLQAKFLRFFRRLSGTCCSLARRQTLVERVVLNALANTAASLPDNLRLRRINWHRLEDKTIHLTRLQDNQ
jgi:hypothetical protein